MSTGTPDIRIKINDISRTLAVLINLIEYDADIPAPLMSIVSETEHQLEGLLRNCLDKTPNMRAPLRGLFDEGSPQAKTGILARVVYGVSRAESVVNERLMAPLIGSSVTPTVVEEIVTGANSDEVEEIAEIVHMSTNSPIPWKLLLQNDQVRYMKIVRVVFAAILEIAERATPPEQ